MADGNVINAASMMNSIFYFPENLILPLNLHEGSYETPYSILNIDMHVIYLLVFGLLIVIYFLLKCLSKKYHKARPLYMKLS